VSPSHSQVSPLTPSPLAAVTQDAIVEAVGLWLATEHGGLLPEFAYVDTSFTRLNAWIRDPGRVPRFGSTVFGPDLTSESQRQLSQSLPGVTLQFVADPESVVDPDGFEHFGCRPYLGKRAMLHLSAPHEVPNETGSYYVMVDIDRGCGGSWYVLEVAVTNDAYDVRAVSQGGWIV
jgi:hypothetical protein